MRLLFKCQRCRLEKRTWSSSRVFGGHYLLNQKLVLFLCVCECVCVYLVYVCMIIQIYFLMCTRVVHSFTCAGILPTQYLKFSMFAGMGRVGHKYMEKGNL